MLWLAVGWALGLACGFAVSLALPKYVRLLDNELALLRHTKSPAALATMGAFFIPEPLGACLVLVAALWWLCRRFSGART
jgi:hypothetical protein